MFLQSIFSRESFVCLNPDFLGVFNPCEPNPCGDASCTVEDGVPVCHGKSSNSIMSDIIIIPSSFTSELSFV